MDGLPDCRKVEIFDKISSIWRIGAVIFDIIGVEAGTAICEIVESCDESSAAAITVSDRLIHKPRIIGICYARVVVSGLEAIIFAFWVTRNMDNAFGRIYEALLEHFGEATGIVCLVKYVEDT